MIVITERSFAAVYQTICAYMARAPKVRTERWQGRDVQKDPAAATYELRNVVFELELGDDERHEHWRREIKPNLPWADDHFAERVSGVPLNPGTEWLNWPWSESANNFRDHLKRFNHSYPERLWPTYAREDEVLVTADGWEAAGMPNKILGRPLGDLGDLVHMMAREPHTRQAWIPLFFPIDTGFADGGRKPCTLGYQFLVRDNRIHVWYPLRSCDLVRHWRDDCYLAVRLLLWVLAECRTINPGFWDKVRPGTYGMHMTSLHIFENDRRGLV